MFLKMDVGKICYVSVNICISIYKLGITNLLFCVCDFCDGPIGQEKSHVYHYVSYI